MYSFVAGIFRSVLYVGYSSKLLNIAAVHPFYYCTIYHMGFPCGLAGKESACNVGHLGSIPGLGRSPGEGGYPLQYSDLENSMDCIVHGVAESYMTERLHSLFGDSGG